MREQSRCLMLRLAVQPRLRHTQALAVVAPADGENLDADDFRIGANGAFQTDRHRVICPIDAVGFRSRLRADGIGGIVLELERIALDESVETLCHVV